MVETTYGMMPHKNAVKEGPEESRRQDLAWKGNTGSREKLDRNHAGTSGDTVRSSTPVEGNPNLERRARVRGRVMA